MTDASSKPTSPKQITPKEFSTNLGSAGIRNAAAPTVLPKRSQISRPKPISAAAAMPVPIAPRLFSHFPTPRPAMFKTVSSASKATEAVKAKALLSAKPW